MTVTQIITWGRAHPKAIFKLDGFGAILSAFLLGVVLVYLESIFGIPKKALYLLAIFPCLFALFDLYCYFKVDNDAGSYMKIIAVCNLLYCILSITLMIYHREELTILGWIYVISEVIIIAILANIELKIAHQLDN